MTEMGERIIARIEQCGGGTTFGELQSIDGFSGELSMGSSQSNCILWTNLSAEFIEALMALIDDGSVLTVPSVPLVYLIDGKMPRLPVGKRNRHYKKPHWLPVVFWTPRQNPSLARRMARAQTRARTAVRRGAPVKTSGDEWFTFFGAVDEWRDTARAVAVQAYQRMLELARLDAERDGDGNG